MMTTRSTSLPKIQKIQNSKNEDFYNTAKFRCKSKQLAMDEDPEDFEIKNKKKIQPINNKALKNSINNVHQLSDLRSRANQFLSNNHKVGVLDHSNQQQLKNKAIMTKLNQAIFMPVITEQEQLSSYLTQLKNQLNYYYNHRNLQQKEIKNINSMNVQIREKIIFYQNLLNQTAEAQNNLLIEREQKILQCRYEMKILQNMKQRGKLINNLMKKRVLTAQALFRSTQHHYQISNQLEGIRQDELDYKVYLCREYGDLQNNKTKQLYDKKEQANYNIEQNRASQLLRMHHQSISIMQRNDYQVQVHYNSSNLLRKNIITQKVLEVILQKSWERQNNKFRDVYHCEQQMKMYCLDKNFILPQTYYESFLLNKQLLENITQKEQKLQLLKQKRKQLEKQWDQLKFREIEQEEERFKSLQKQVQISSNQRQALIKLNQKILFDKQIFQRKKIVQQKYKLLNRLKNWIRKEQNMMKLFVSKKCKAYQHLIKIMQNCRKQLQELHKQQNNENRKQYQILQNNTKISQTNQSTAKSFMEPKLNSKIIK